MSSQAVIGRFKLTPEKLNKDEELRVFDQHLIETETTRANLERILYPLFENRNVLLVGDAGIGKNALVYYINKKRNIPTIRFSFNQDTLPEDLVGSFRVLPDGFHWHDGPLVEAMRKGYTFVADEMNLASPEILKRFISVLETRSLTLLEKDSEEIKAHPRFTFVATQNPARGFEGRKILPESISRHFTTVHLDSYSVDEEIEIMQGLFEKTSKELLGAVVNLQRLLEKQTRVGDIASDDLEHYHFNIRTGQMFFKRLQGTDVKEKNDPEFLFNVFAFYVDLFKKADDRRSALEAVAKALQLESSELNELYAAYNNRAPREETGSLFAEAEIEEAGIDPLPLTEGRLVTIDDMLKSLDSEENLLLEGPESARIGELVRALAQVKGVGLRRIYLSRGMHTSEIIGALRPAGESVKWADGPLTAGLRNQDWVLLDNIEAAGSELVEKMNMLLDHAGSLAMPPEAGGEPVLKKEGSARIIAIKRNRSSRNQPTVSRAFRNRFFSMRLGAIEEGTELEQSAAICWSLYFEGQGELSETLLEKLLLFHEKIREASLQRKIASVETEPVKFREENLLRFITHIHRWLDGDSSLTEVLKNGADVHYISSLPTPKDREWAAQLWQRIFHDLPVDQLYEELVKGKKKIMKGSKPRKKMTWDPEKHFRLPNTGKAKPRLSGKKLKKGLRINTPETGGQIKEGPDAWYGQDTEGNMGVGEPAGGGGAWGYRTEELFEAFLKKYRPKWDYNMGYTLKDYYDVFGRMLEDLDMNIDALLESQMDIKRRLASQGNRVEARKYLTYRAGYGSDRIFDKTAILHSEDKLKGLEVLFLINKGRRLFNFEYSIASVTALQSAIEILWDHKIPVRVVGFSDFDNMKSSVNLDEYTEDFYGFLPTDKEKNAVFDAMVDNWHGDTVDEAEVLPSVGDYFSPEAVTRLVITVSDFRGHRARAKLEDEVSTRSFMILREMVNELTSREYLMLGVQTGTRYLAEHAFEHHLWINGENFNHSPVILSDMISKLILKYHRVTV